VKAAMAIDMECETDDQLTADLASTTRTPVR